MMNANEHIPSRQLEFVKMQGCGNDYILSIDLKIRSMIPHHWRAGSPTAISE